MSHKCSVCEKQFARSDSLKLHVKRLHLENFHELYKEKQTSFKCNVCNKYFARQYSLKIHVKNIHKGLYEQLYPNKIFNFPCKHCDKRFNSKHCLKSHIKSKHAQIFHASFTQITQKLCGICKNYVSEEKFGYMEAMIDHLKKNHDISIQSKYLRFSSVSEFTDWKTSVEEENRTQFKKETTKSSKNHVFIRYVCNRSGFYKPRGKGKRHLKLQGSKKIGAYCPSSIKLVIKTDGSCTAKFINTHVGHKPEFSHMTLTKQEKELIAKQISEKIPFGHILDQIRNSVVNLNLNRIHLSNRKDLFNIESSYHLGHPPTWHKNDAVSVDALVNSMKSHGECVLLYKPQDSVNHDYPHLKYEDFILIIMTNTQAEILKKYGEDIICIDGTHGTNNYDFELHTLMVVDELREGFPCAFLISNRSDQEVLNIYFLEIQKKVGTISCRIFMSDMAEGYFNSWLHIMGLPGRRLYCTWHVDRAWRKNINSKIASKELRVLVYKQLRVLLQERDKISFEKMVFNFIEEHSQNKNMNEFLNYFNLYFKKMETWAYCYRKHAKINTNMRLERLHKTIKYEYLNGKKVKRLDKSIQTIMRMVHNKLFEKLISNHKGKLCTAISNLRIRHKKSESMDEKLVIKSSNAFIVQSSNLSELYHVYGDTKTCKCSLRCVDCDTCIHEFYCTCLDSSIKFNMCKHIHLVARLTKCVTNTQIGQNTGHIGADSQESNLLVIDEEPQLEQYDTVLKEVSLIKNVSERTTEELKKKQDKLIKTLTDIVRGTHSMEEIESLEAIASSMVPVIAAVQERKESCFTMNKNFHTGKITQQRRLYSRKKKKDQNKRLSDLEEVNSIALNLSLGHNISCNK